MKPTVILAAPYLYGMDQCIERNLTLMGYRVVNLCVDDRDSRPSGVYGRLKAFYHKKIRPNPDYRKQLRFAPHIGQIERQMAALDGRPADYALCICAHIYPRSIMESIRRNARVCVNYQWDGIGRFPDILDYLPYFDRMLVFDPADAVRYQQYGFQTACNFYFDLPAVQAGSGGGIYFLGGYESNRQAATLHFVETARRLNLPLDFKMYCKDRRAQEIYGEEGFSYLNRQTELSFTQNLQNVQNCLAVADFVQFADYGLSFRIFEALCFDKKLITTNQTVRQYDFYRPENILVWDGRQLDGQQLSDFLNTPYRPVEPAIKQYYGFSQWFARAVAGLPASGEFR